MNFLPENYEAPKTSGFYMRLQEGENRFRILSAPILGWEDWQNKKPIRFTMDSKPASPIDAKKPVKHFWAFVVFNYNEEQIQILQITQATIRKSLEALCKDQDWGSPYFYDIKIHKTGEMTDTEYNVNPVPHKPLDPFIIKQFKDRPCNLNALFTNEDPFATHWDSYVSLAIESVEQPKAEEKKLGIAVRDLADLRKSLAECDPAYQTQLLKTLKDMKPSIDSIDHIPVALFEKVKKAVIKNRNEYQSTLEYSEQLFPVK